jgi:hypothetical protein
MKKVDIKHTWDSRASYFSGKNFTLTSLSEAIFTCFSGKYMHKRIVLYCTVFVSGPPVPVQQKRPDKPATVRCPRFADRLAEIL